ncbi:MAG: flavin-dependent dehydrogenase, partial [Pirellulaceae bacterium]
MLYDLAIVGRGIAASAALIALRGSGLRVAVVAPSRPPGFRIGESLSPTANEELSSLGILDAFLKERHWEAHTRFVAWEDPILREQYAWESRNAAGWYLDRAAFEEFLWREANATEFDLHETKVVNAEHEECDGTVHWRIQCMERGDIHARLLLDCSGRRAVVAEKRTPRSRRDKLVGLYTVLQHEQIDIDPTKATLVEAVSNGWWYSVLVPGTQLVVAYFTDSDLMVGNPRQDFAAWENLLALAPYTSERIRSAGFTSRNPPSITDASSKFTVGYLAPNLLAAGDAVASFDPLSSHGMTTALWSGRLAASAATSLVSGSVANAEAYQRKWEAGISEYQQTHQQIYAAVERFRGETFWMRRSL